MTVSQGKTWRGETQVAVGFGVQWGSCVAFIGDRVTWSGPFASRGASQWKRRGGADQSTFIGRCSSVFPLQRKVERIYDSTDSGVTGCYVPWNFSEGDLALFGALVSVALYGVALLHEVFSMWPYSLSSEYGA